MKNIVLIDDDPLSIYVNSMLLKEALEVSEITQFSLVEEALSYFSQPVLPTPQLILLDINLPSLDAWDFLELLPRQNVDPSELPIVLLSSHLSPKDQENIKAYGMEEAVLTKPLKIEELLKLPAIQ